MKLPNNLDTLQTGTSTDGRPLISIRGLPSWEYQSALSDVRARLPNGWTAEIYETSGVDIVLTLPSI